MDLSQFPHYGLSVSDFIRQAILEDAGDGDHTSLSTIGSDEFGLKALTASNIYVENCWIAIYNTIYTANQIITNIDGISDPLLSEELRNDIKGEALTIRALAHFDLLRMWGEHWDITSPLGIPVVTSILSIDDAAIPRNTVVETYDAILTDLLIAESILSDDDLRFDEPTFKGTQFISKTACQAL